MVVPFKQANARATSPLAVRVGRTRCPVTGIPDEWSSLALAQGQNPAYRPSGFFYERPGGFMPVSFITKTSSC